MADNAPSPPFLRRSVPMGTGAVSILDIGDQARPVDLIWCHATGFNAQTYLPALLPLGAHLRILAVDLRGHGQTSLPADPKRLRSWRRYGADVVALLDAMGIVHPVTLAGHSMGGATALTVAGTRGARVKALALFDPVILPKRAYQIAAIPGFNRFMFRKTPMVTNALRRRASFASLDEAFETYRKRRAFQTWLDDALRSYVEGGFATDAAGVHLTCAPAWEAATFRGAMSVNLWRDLGRLRIPVTILRADSGSTCALRDDDMLAMLPGRSVQTIAGSTHFLPIERPELLRETLLRACQ